jgi:hypothetical protein
MKGRAGFSPPAWHGKWFPFFLVRQASVWTCGLRTSLVLANCRLYLELCVSNTHPRLSLSQIAASSPSSVDSLR